MQKEIYNWILLNVGADEVAEFPEKKDFWVIPTDKKDPNYQNIVDALTKRFTETTITSCKHIDELGIVIIKESEKVIVCGVYKDGHTVINVSSLPVEGAHVFEITFLQKIAILSKLGVKAAKLIDREIWINSPIFETDLIDFLPQIVCFEMDNALVDDSEASLILKFVLCLELSAKNVKIFQAQLIEVVLSIPVIDHEWLINQLLYAVLSGRNSNFYVELYKLVEFFFPLFSISKLKKNIGFAGTHLDLLKKCMSDLHWHVNHQRGSLLSLNYASVDFAEAILEKNVSSETSMDDIRKFKEQAMEKITNIRHSLIHQSYEQNEPADVDIYRATHSILIFLASAFKKYSLELKAR